LKGIARAKKPGVLLSSDVWTIVSDDQPREDIGEVVDGTIVGDAQPPKDIGEVVYPLGSGLLSITEVLYFCLVLGPLTDWETVRAEDNPHITMSSAY
jgi:hypothetical protein